MVSCPHEAIVTLVVVVMKLQADDEFKAEEIKKAIVATYVMLTG